MADMNLDLESVDLDDINLEDIDLSDFGEVNESIDMPHIKVSSKQLKEFLKVAMKVCSSGGKDIVSKAVCLCYNGDGRVVGYATDFDVYVQQSFECLNVENILTEHIIIPTQTLVKLCSAVPTNTLLYKKDDKFFIRLFGGDMEVETHNMSLEKFQFNEAVSRIDTVPALSLYSTIKDFGPVITAAMNPAEKRLLVEEGGAYASYMFSILKTEAIKGKYDLKTKDIDVLKILTVNKKEEDLVVYKTTDESSVSRVVIEGTDFKYAFLVSESSVSPTLKDNMEKVVGESGVFVDFIQLYKMIELASELPYAIGKVGINYTDSGIRLDIKTKKGDSNTFEISGSPEGGIAPLDKELVVQAKLLKIVLRSFASQASIRVSVSADGLGIKAGDYSGVLYSEAE